MIVGITYIYMPLMPSDAELLHYSVLPHGQG